MWSSGRKPRIPTNAGRVANRASGLSRNGAVEQSTGPFCKKESSPTGQIPSLFNGEHSGVYLDFIGAWDRSAAVARHIYNIARGVRQTAVPKIVAFV